MQNNLNHETFSGHRKDIKKFIHQNEDKRCLLQIKFGLKWKNSQKEVLFKKKISSCHCRLQHSMHELKHSLNWMITQKSYILKSFLISSVEIAT